MKTQYYVASTLDGFIATESDSLDWLFPLGSVQESSYPEFIEGVALRDELIVQIGSATLGAGKPLFPRKVLSPTLRLMSVYKMGVGMIELRYEINRNGTIAG